MEGNEQQLYDGPHRVLKRSAKFYTLDHNGFSDTMSVTHLKPAHLDTLPDVVIPQATQPVVDHTVLTQPRIPHHSVQCVHWLKHLANFIA